MIKFFSRLQWKLTFSYAFVTISTISVIAVSLVIFAVTVESQNTNHVYSSFYWSKTGFQDNIPLLLEEPTSLQTWLERVQSQGFTVSDFRSYSARETLAQANTLVTGTPIYLLDPDLNLIAVAPNPNPDEIGKPFQERIMGSVYIQGILNAAQIGDKNYYAQSIIQSDGSYLVAFPLRKSDNEPVVAIILYQVQPFTFIALPNLEIYYTFLFATIMIVFITALPVGTVFGWLASRGLRKRLANLSTAAQAWSTGDFSPTASDKSGDEIGELTRALNLMAEQLQTHVTTREELSRIEERNRLARDLHDTVKQQTYAARMQLSAAKNLLASDTNSAAEHLEAALQLNRETQQELKLIIDELRPPALEGRGLAPALSEYAARWQEHTGIKVETTISGERPLPLDVEETLYRILQESLSNIARHAEADLVTLTLSMTPEQATLTIADNGRGFEPAAITPHSLGLSGMKSRLAEISGVLTVDTALGTGTKVIAEVQLSQ
ncbi:MAG: sensor histidine kinase [Anaerolineales bacterium]